MWEDWNNFGEWVRVPENLHKTKRAVGKWKKAVKYTDGILLAVKGYKVTLNIKNYIIAPIN